MKVAILYGSSTGKTEAVAALLQSLIPGSTLLEISQSEPDELDGFDAVILGTSTWGTGALQDSWLGQLPHFRPACLQNKAVAFFGLGDRVTFPDTFCAAVAILKKHFASTAQQLPIDDLLLDDDNEPRQTVARVTAWAEKLKEVGLGNR